MPSTFYIVFNREPTLKYGPIRTNRYRCTRNGQKGLEIVAKSLVSVLTIDIGAGKSTYCRAAGNYLNSINRETIVINLDPAVKSPDAAIDICALGLVSNCLVLGLFEQSR